MSRSKKKKAEELPTLSQLVSGLSEMRDEQMEFLREAIPADRIPVHAEDHLIVAALRRSLDNVSGFLAMADQRNIFCGMPIIRFQIDTAMRLCGRHLVKDIEDYVQAIASGENVSNYKGSNGKELKDESLHKFLTKRHPGSSDLYKEGNEYIHFSDQHIHRILDLDYYKKHGDSKFKDPEEMTVGWSDEEFREALVSMMWATEAVLSECKIWLESKRKRPKISEDGIPAE